ncbi:MAG: hypothetical protein QNJ92_00530 [Alphaproteobacteria bacterium]|nr:hypothetical protein [Alphaproteobacteria bacterium]
MDPTLHAARGRFVWVMANTYTRWLWKALARDVGQRTELRPVLMVGTEQDRKFYARQYGEEPSFEIVVLKDPYEVIISGGDPKLSHDGVVERARQIEDDFGIGIMRQLVLSDRHLGRGFMPGGAGHPRSRISRAATPKLTLEACVSQFEFFEELSHRYPPGLVVSYYGGGGLIGKPVSLICRRKNIPFRTLCPARFGDLMYWADDEYEGSARLRKALTAPRPDLRDEEIMAARQLAIPTGFSTHAPSIAAMQGMRRWSQIIRFATRRLLEQCYGRIRGYQLARTGYLVSSEIAQALRTRRHFKELDRIARREIPEPSGRKIVYFPLQQEPEASTLVLSPEHTNQMATIIELTLSLTADAILVVKEHIWQVGRRPDGYYRALSEIPNVLLVHPEASSRAIIEKASLVCTITSSAGHEAAAMGKPVVQFWRRSPLSVLPHVNIMSGFGDMERIRQILSHDSEQDRQERERQGAAYLHALGKFCMDLGPLHIHGREARPTEAELELLTSHLLASLDGDDAIDGGAPISFSSHRHAATQAGSRR